MALPRGYRLTRNSDFEHVSKIGKSIRTELFRIKVASNGLQKTRFGVTTSAKLFPGAVVRTALRRIILGRLRELVSRVTVGYDVVIFPLVDFRLDPEAAGGTLERVLREQHVIS